MLLDWLSTDGKLILSARIIRTFAYGFLSIVFAIYLKLLGFNDVLIGVVLTATLVNSVIFTLIASFYADRIGRRKILIIYGALMSIAGAIFLATENYFALIQLREQVNGSQLSQNDWFGYGNDLNAERRLKMKTKKLRDHKASNILH